MTGEMLATQLKISLATIRADLRLLTTVGILDARPKVGYAYQGASVLSVDNDALFNTPIAKILLPPTEIKLTTSMEEAVTKLFLADVGSLYVLDDDGALVGLISRKDLLRASFTDRDTTLPASIVMTRMPNVVTVTADTTIMAASKLLLKHNVDSLPVIQKHGDTHVIGKITKNRIFKYLIETLAPWGWAFICSFKLKVSYFSILARNRTLFTFLIGKFLVVTWVVILTAHRRTCKKIFVYYIALWNWTFSELDQFLSVNACIFAG